MDCINYTANMNWLHNAIEMNVKGAALYSQGHEAMALEYFKGGLEVLSWVARKSDDVGQLVNPSAYQLGQRKCQVNHSVKNDCKNNYIYDKTFQFSASATDPHKICFFMAVLEFNMALCLQSLSQGLGERSLINSLHIYDCCLEHICRSQCDGALCSEYAWQVLLFAALNNKATILTELCRFELARDVLLSLMKALRCYGGFEEGCIDENDLEGFLFNVMLLKGISTSPAA